MPLSRRAVNYSWQVFGNFSSAFLHGFSIVSGLHFAVCVVLCFVVLCSCFFLFSSFWHFIYCASAGLHHDNLTCILISTTIGIFEVYVSSYILHFFGNSSRILVLIFWLVFASTSWSIHSNFSAAIAISLLIWYASLLPVLCWHTFLLLYGLHCYFRCSMVWLSSRFLRSFQIFLLMIRLCILWISIWAFLALFMAIFMVHFFLSLPCSVILNCSTVLYFSQSSICCTFSCAYCQDPFYSVLQVYCSILKHISRSFLRISFNDAVRCVLNYILVLHRVVQSVVINVYGL